MNERRQKLLDLVVENHIGTAEPVGSKFLASSDDVDWSEATVRNELRELEEEGYLTHPHTSAGRVPTSKGYQYYVENIMKPGGINKARQNKLEQLWQGQAETPKKIKAVGKQVSELARGAVIVAFNRDNLYYTGISYLFSQPEFCHTEEISNLSAMIDRCEEYIDELFEVVKGERTYVLIGDNNPFGHECSLLTARFAEQSLFSLLGPLRMNYKENIALVEFVRRLVSS